MQKIETDIVIVGSGAGGATVARELAKGAKKVVLVEQGLSLTNDKLGTEILAYNFYDKHGLWSKTKEGVFYYRTIMAGGTTVVSCANAVRSLENELKNLGIDLTEEFSEIEQDLSIQRIPEELLGPANQKIMDSALKLGFPMDIMPKSINFKTCISCGDCILGCRTGAKWSALKFIDEAIQRGVSFLSGIEITKVLLEDGHAVGVEGQKKSGEKIQIFARIVVLAAGGLATPLILQNTGIDAGKKLFLDLFTVTIGFTKDIGLSKEIPMATLHKNDGFILSSFIDTPFVLASVIPTSLRRGIKLAQREHMLGIMVKIKDDSIGSVEKDGQIKKIVTKRDLEKLNKGQSIAKEILIKSGVDKTTIITTKVRGAHPGATAAIGEVVSKDLETGIKRLFVCDCSVLPESAGLPPIMTIAALGKRLSKFLKNYN
jgi:choline dehydrogenase-like flavoprotein